MKISATDPTSGRSVAVEITSIGESLDEAISLVGAEVVYSNYKKSAVISAQANIRRRIKKGDTDTDIQTALAPWKPGVAVVRETDPLAAIQKRMDKMTPEQKAKFRAELLASLSEDEE